MSELALAPLDFSTLWTYAEAARYLKIKESTLRDRVKRGYGPVRLKNGNTAQADVRFRPQDIVAYSEMRVVKPRKRSGRPRKPPVSNATTTASTL